MVNRYKQIQLFLLYVLFILFYSLWTYTQTDPNLLLLNWQPYINFQNWMWQVNDQFVTISYVAILVGLFMTYWLILREIKDKKSKIKNIFFESLTKIFPSFLTNHKSQTTNHLQFFVPILVILLVSYNALSHDIFNYIFNARMVLKYGADPHVRTALEFASQDDWVRFMHNIHTPAPYWYGWTAISLLPYLLGLGKFLTTWLAFKLFSAIGLVLLLIVQWKLVEKLQLGKEGKFWFLAFVLNPLVLIELVSNGHNDAWMMVGGLGSLLIISQITSEDPSTSLRTRLLMPKRKLTLILLSLALLLFSMSIKIATVVLIPIWFLILVQSSKFKVQNWRLKFLHPWMIEKIEYYLYDLSSLLLFLPLLTSRSQQFHPWYLVWSLSFLPFMKIKEWRNALLILSISSMFRYVPWLANGGFEFTDQIQIQQKLITWLPVIGYIFFKIYRKVLKQI